MSLPKIQEANMTKTQIAKQIFGVPSLETSGRIDDHDKCVALDAATFRCGTRMRELEMQFEAKAGEIRAAYVTECAGIIDPE
jgi:hypothetical protein